MVDKIILWFLLALGIALFIFSLRKQPIKEWILYFLLTAYFTTFLGMIVVNSNMLKYPIDFLGHYIPSSLLFGDLLFPVVGIYFYQTTYRSSPLAIVGQCALYTSALTVTEVIIERYTDLVEYITWHWLHTLLSVFCLMLFIRFLMKLISRKNE